MAVFQKEMRWQAQIFRKFQDPLVTRRSIRSQLLNSEGSVFSDVQLDFASEACNITVLHSDKVIDVYLFDLIVPQCKFDCSSLVGDRGSGDSVGLIFESGQDLSGFGFLGDFCL